MVVVKCKYLVHNGDPNCSPADCLQETQEYKDCDLEHRVLSCSAFTGYYGDYTLDHDRATLFNRVLAVPEHGRHYCAIVPSDQPVLFYADLDVKDPPPNLTREALLNTVLDVVERCYRSVYGQD